jgi:small ligand-binding sensory domain FIST
VNTESQFASAFALASDWRSALEACLDRLVVPRGANLGFVYWADAFNREAEMLVQQLRKRTGVTHWVGGSAVGLLGREGAQLDTPGVSLLVARLPDDSFRVFSGREPLGRARDFSPETAIVHADPDTPDMPELVRDMAGKLPSAKLAGGLMGGRDSSVLFADGSFSGGLCGVAFDAGLALTSDISQACRPIGPPREIGEAEDNLLGKLDGRPALAVYRDAIGPLLADNLRRAVHSVMVGLVSDEDPSRYIVRHVVGVDPAGGRIAINDTPTEGQELMFVRRDADTAAQDLERMLERMRERCPHPRAALYISCAGRGAQLFERDDSEVEAIQAVFGGIPLAGFFAGGEILGRELYAYTGVLTLFP